MKEFMDELEKKVQEGLEIAGSVIVNVGEQAKQTIDKAVLDKKLSDLYKKLGEMYYREQREHCPMEAEAILWEIDEIKQKNSSTPL